MANTDRKGRRKSGPPFAQLHHFVFDSAAYRSLNPAERAVYGEILRRYTGANNGRIALSCRDAARLCHINKDTANRALRRLMEVGLIALAQPGGFSMKLPHSAEWRLTQFRSDLTGHLPSREFMTWAAENAKRGPLKPDKRSPESGQEEIGSADLSPEIGQAPAYQQTDQSHLRGHI